MKLSAVSPIVKVAAVVALGAGFAAAIGLAATGGGGRDTPSALVAETATPTRVAERTPRPAITPAGGIPPRATVPPPVIPQRTVIPGADKGGLFADGVKDLAKVDTTGWKTYTNAKYGYSFKYPPAWEFQEQDNSALRGPRGEPAYPLQTAEVRNPTADQGENTPGTNCQGASCLGTRPKELGFIVTVTNSLCSPLGDLIASDSITLDGRQGGRCVLQSPNDQVSRSVSIRVPLGDGKNFVVVGLRRGRAIVPSEQAVLETILSTFTFAR